MISNYVSRYKIGDYALKSNNMLKLHRRKLVKQKKQWKTTCSICSWKVHNP